jgi:hypothetical protein
VATLDVGVDMRAVEHGAGDDGGRRCGCSPSRVRARSLLWLRAERLAWSTSPGLALLLRRVVVEVCASIALSTAIARKHDVDMRTPFANDHVYAYMCSMARQGHFEFRTWGGKRRGAGRKRVAARPQVPHRPRERVNARHPILVTTRVMPDVARLRTDVMDGAVREAVTRATRWLCEPEAFRIVHASVQDNHLHLLVEAESNAALTRGMKGFLVSCAKRLNAIAGRRGRVFADRFHSASLATPRQVRNGPGLTAPGAWARSQPAAAAAGRLVERRPPRDHLRRQHRAVGHAGGGDGVVGDVRVADDVVGPVAGVGLAVARVLGVAGEDLGDDRLVEEDLAGHVLVSAEADLEVDVDRPARVPAGKARVEVDAATGVGGLHAAEVAMGTGVGVAGGAEVAGVLARVEAAALGVPDVDDGTGSQVSARTIRSARRTGRPL